MGQINHQDAVVTARDTLFGDDDTDGRLGPAGDLSQTEIDELLYTEEIPASERVIRLRQMREQLVGAGSVDASESDAPGMLREIDRAIAEIEGLKGEGMDPASVDHNPEDHRETLSPDDDLLLDLQNGEDGEEADLFGEDYVEEPAEESGKGVH
jgi:hypothetical protein